MVNNYKNLPIYSLGFSDVGSLIMRGLRDKEGLVLEELNFGSDGEYFARIGDADNPCFPPYDGFSCLTVFDKVPSHYHLVSSFVEYLDIFDDEMRTLRIEGNRIYVYRAGVFGCLILTDGGVGIAKYSGELKEAVYGI